MKRNQAIIEYSTISLHPLDVDEKSSIFERLPNAWTGCRVSWVKVDIMPTGEGTSRCAHSFHARLTGAARQDK